MVSRLNEPMLEERVNRDNWNFIRYDDLEDFSIGNKNRDTINPVQMEALAKMPYSRKKERQIRFDEYHN